MKPVLPGWLFTELGTAAFTFLGHTTITYHNPERIHTYQPGIRQVRIVLNLPDDSKVTIESDVIGPPYAEMVRAGKVDSIDVHMEENL